MKFVIPGWDIPWTQIPLYVGILLIAALVHEMGHMLAALSTNVPVTSMGFILLAVYFGAYVEIDAAAVSEFSLIVRSFLHFEKGFFVMFLISFS